MLRVCAVPSGAAQMVGVVMTVFVALLTVEYTLHGNDSLKGKRRVADSLKRKVRNRFNVAIAETDSADALTRLRLAVTSLSNSEAHLQRRMNQCLLMMEAVCPEEMTFSNLEVYAVE